MNNTNPKTKKLFLAAGIIGYLIFLLVYINGSYPYVGHDFRYFDSRLFDTYIHYIENGLTIQWYSPSFGGGLPAYHNPLHMQFSITQLLVFVTTPWMSILITTVLFSVIGYYLAYRFAVEILNIRWEGAVLGAVFFLSTGFYTQHMAAGALSYSIYPATSLIYYCLFSKKTPGWLNGLIIGITIAITLHNSGFYLLVIIALTILILPSLVYLLAPKNFDLKRFIFTGIVGAITAGLLTAGKLYAVFSFMEHFPRDLYQYTEEFTTYYSSHLAAMAGFMLQFIGIPLFTPPFRALMADKTGVVQMMTALIGGQQLGIWEIDASISPTLIYIFLYQIRMAPARLKEKWQKQTTKWSISPQKLLAVLLLAFSLLLSYQMTTRYGFLYQLLHTLPIFRSLTVHTRFASVFIFPLSMAGAYFFNTEFDRLQARKRAQAFYVFFGGTLILLNVYFFLPYDIQSRGYDLSSAKSAYHSFKEGDDMYVEQIAVVQDSDVFYLHASSLFPYEPIFGYDLEQFTPQVVPGPIDKIDGQYYNMTNPSSLVYDTEELFTRFTLDEKEKMEQFASYQQPDWEIPQIQHTLNTISLVSFIAAIITPGGYLLWQQRKKKNKT